MNWYKISQEQKTYPLARSTISGLTIQNADNIPNLDSIDATLDKYTILTGIREIPTSDFGLTGKHYSVQGNNAIRSLQSQIESSNKITPLIVVVDSEGPYILEGSTRIDALYNMGIKTFPALVVIDESETNTNTPEDNYELV